VHLVVIESRIPQHFAQVSQVLASRGGGLEGRRLGYVKCVSRVCQDGFHDWSFQAPQAEKWQKRPSLPSKVVLGRPEAEGSSQFKVQPQ
jgi:hypothetical protein